MKEDFYDFDTFRIKINGYYSMTFVFEEEKFKLTANRFCFRFSVAIQTAMK